MPLLTNHLNLQRLALQGLRGKVIRVLGRLPLFAPSSLISIRTIFWDSGIKPLEKNSESEWKAIDLALCNPKFPHLKSVEFTGPSSKPPQNPHAFFQQSLPTCYKRGMLWYRPGFKGSYFILIMLPHPDLCRHIYAHRSSGCAAIPWITS